MSDSLAKTALNYVKDKHVMTLATYGSEGLWAAAVFFVNDGFDFYFLSSPATRHGKNMADSVRVSATIQLDYDNWQDIKGVQMEGEIELLEGLDKSAAISRYAKKFPVIQTALKSPTTIGKAMKAVSWYRLRPQRLFFIDNAKGFGHRDEIELK